MVCRIITVFFMIFSITSSYPQSIHDTTDSGKYIVAYVFVEDELLDEQTILSEKLTHINYAFADIRGGVVVEGFQNDSSNIQALHKTKSRNPDLKILVSIGGWTWSGNFSDIVLTKESRTKFITSVIEFIKRHNLDGIDFDWEFPNLKGYGNIHRPEDKENFTIFLKEMREALDGLGKEENKYYLQTIAAGAFGDYVDNTEMGKVQMYCDFINIMAYDLYEAEADSIAGHHSPLFTHPDDKKNLSADAAVRLFLNAGVPPRKIVLGVPFYGRSAEVFTAENHGLYQKAVAPKNRIWASIRNIKTNLENKNGFVRYWDEFCKVPYLFNEKEMILVFYDDEESLTGKCEYIKQNNLKGAMFWEYHSDYKHILLDTLYENLKVPDNDSSTEE